MLTFGPIERQRGVTLIELMIAMAIFALLLGFGVPSYRDWIQSSQIRTAAQSILDGLQLARTEAVRRNSSVQFQLTSLPATSWTVQDVNAAQVIQSRAGTEGTPNAQASLNPTAGTNPVTFNGLGRVTSAGVTISVTNPSGGACQSAGGGMRCLNVVVPVGGQIRLCDPALPSSNPQSCSY